MRAKSFHLSVRGASHIRKNRECQDSSGNYLDENMAIAIVCDGHGGDDYVRSALGSAYACEIAERNIREFVEGAKLEDLEFNHKQLISTLEASIINDWNEAVSAHCSGNPFTDSELVALSDKAKRRYLQERQIEGAYGTTLIAVALTPDYWFGIHIGDGKCVAISPDGEFTQPIPWDDRCFLNATTSICDSDALSHFRYFYSRQLPAAVFVGSDGVDDCFSNDQQLNNLYKTVLYSFATSEFEKAVSDLREYLPRLSAKGSGDDVSIAAVLDLDLIGEIGVVKEFDREKERARIEEIARREAERAEQERIRYAARAEAGSAPRFCRHCGAPLTVDMKFCGQCGNKVATEEAPKEEHLTAPKEEPVPVPAPMQTEEEPVPVPVPMQTEESVFVPLADEKLEQTPPERTDGDISALRAVEHEAASQSAAGEDKPPAAET